MSSEIPKIKSSFGLADLEGMLSKSSPVKKDSLAAAPIPKIPTGRLKCSGSKKRKANPGLELENFEGLSMAEVSNKLLSMQTIMSLAMEVVEQLDEANEKVQGLIKIAEEKAKFFNRQEQDYRRVVQEHEDLKATLEEEKAKVVDEAKKSAAISILELMIKMAGEATAEGLTVKAWDPESLKKILRDLSGKDAEDDGAETSKAGEEQGRVTAGEETPGGDGKDAEA